MNKEINIGDIIVISSYITPDNVKVSQHSFVVLQNKYGKIAGVEIALNLDLEFDLVGAVMSSIKNKAHKKKITSYYPKDMLIEFNDVLISNGNRKNGFIKANQLHYFKRDRIKFIKIGKLTTPTFNKLIELIQLNDELGDLTENFNNILNEKDNDIINIS